MLLVVKKTMSKKITKTKEIKKSLKSASKNATKVKSKKVTTTKSKKALKSVLPSGLGAKDVFKECPVSLFNFKTTKQFKSTNEIISQKRAVRAIEMGLGIRKSGYNIYVAGVGGTGKNSVIKSFLEKWSKDSKSPSDWIYVYDFQAVESPRAIEMKTGEAHKFAKRMEHSIKVLTEEIPQALQSEDYENAVNAFSSQIGDRKARMYSELEKLAKSLDFQIKSSQIGIETIPIIEGRPLTEKEYNKLTDAQRTDIEKRRNKLEPEVLDFARRVRGKDNEIKEYIDTLQQEIGKQVVSAILNPLIDDFVAHKEITDYLQSVYEDILDHLLDFVIMEEHVEDEYSSGYMDRKEKFEKYKVNVFIDNRKQQGAPVVIETNPTYYNLFGKIEKNIEHGMYLTSFTRIHAGSIHKANGGYLVLDAQDMFKTPSVWDTLKRVLRNRKGFIEDMGEQYSMLPTSGLRPEPVPLDVKVILIGTDEIYHLLYEMDEDFSKIFKIKADFDYKMPRVKENINAYAAFIATRSKMEDLLEFDRSGVAAIVEYGSRLVDDQNQLTTQFGQLKDLTIEADFIAREAGSKLIKREHVHEALEQKLYRVNLYEEHLMDMLKTEDIMISVEGERIGQVNGLAVYDLGDFSFGKIGRITCAVSMSDDGIFNIDRASKLSGNIHDKGMYILNGYLNAVLAKEQSLGFSASICFEQSYGIIDGDSATIAELTAIVSAVADIPVKQNLAMTGSLNQFGDVQPVGGINEKIEGFYKTCQILGKKDGKYTVLIPFQNSTNLMLNEETRTAVATGKLTIIPVRYIWEAFELATGVPLGCLSVHGEEIQPNSAFDKIQKKLKEVLKHHEEEHKHEVQK